MYAHPKGRADRYYTAYLYSEQRKPIRGTSTAAESLSKGLRADR
jgi:hypothetical protein